MSIAKQPSKLSLPQINPGVSSVLQFLARKFPSIPISVWRQRMEDGKVHWHDGRLITPTTAYQPQQRVYYYREVNQEPCIPFDEEILFQDEQLLVAYKPHFLPVTPGGAYINECLQNRLRDKTGISDLQALHRLDRDTAGLVLFSIQPKNRQLYHHLFASRKIQKTYQAIAQVQADSVYVGQHWQLKNRLVKSTPSFLMKITDGPANSHSNIKCVRLSANKALFELSPISGKTHQLRVHMQSLGIPILHDRYYPLLADKQDDNYSQPLQLLAKSINFIDPVNQHIRSFSCNKNLSLA
ncbi:MAG: pseudouridine synthase [Cycloclasticus sp.]